MQVSYTHMVRIAVPYAYGCTIRVWLYRTRIRIWYVPYAYGTKYAYGIEHAHQTGHHVERRFGWDCHGLPVEYEIDKTLGIKVSSMVYKPVNVDT